MRYILVLVCYFIYFGSWAQVQQPARFEQIQKNSDDNFTIVSMDDEGIALFRETDKYKDGKHSWQLIVIDSALQQQVDTLITIDREYGVIGYEYIPGKLIFLYQVGQVAQNKLFVVSYTTSTREIKQTEIKTELDLKLTHFSSIGNSILLGGYISNEPTILIYDAPKSNIQVIPGFIQRNTELLDLRSNQNNTFNVVVGEKVSAQAKKIIFKTFDLHGKLLLEDVIESEENKTILSAITSSLQREDLILLGTWSNKSSTRAYGFFATMINPFEKQPIKFTYFGELTNYLNFLKPNRVEKIKSRTKEALAAGKTYDYANYVLPYKIIEYDKGFIALAETYSTTSISRSNYNPYNNPNNQNSNNPYYYNNPYYNLYPTSRLYQPYAYNENVNNDQEIKTYASALLLYNSKGEIENDYSIKIDNIKIPALRQVADAGVYNNTAVFFYKKEKELLYKKIDLLADEATEGKESIRLTDSFDELRYENETDGGIRHWYKNFFYCWGYQTIRNIQTNGDKSREVFYINKVSVR
jgi:hypothetical protein